MDTKKVGNLFKDCVCCTEKTCLLHLLSIVCPVSPDECFFLWAYSAEGENMLNIFMLC